MTFGLIGLLVILAWWFACVSKWFDLHFPWPATARWTLGICAALMILVGTEMGEPGCYIEWDGHTNSRICD